MVRGVGIAVTKVAGRYQWAETQTTARGRGMSLPMDAQPCVQTLCVSAFIGLPCPKKMAGMGDAIFNTPHFVGDDSCSLSVETVRDGPRSFAQKSNI